MLRLLNYDSRIKERDAPASREHNNTSDIYDWAKFALLDVNSLAFNDDVTSRTMDRKVHEWAVWYLCRDK